MKKIELERIPIKASEITKLARKALRNKPTWKPSKGYKYLKDCNMGDMVLTGNQEAIVTEPEYGEILVISSNCSNEDKSFYLGSRRWSTKTEVKIIRRSKNEK